MGYYDMGRPPKGPPKWLPKWFVKWLADWQEVYILTRMALGIVLPIFGLLVSFALLCLGGIFLLSWLTGR